MGEERKCGAKEGRGGRRKGRTNEEMKVGKEGGMQEGKKEGDLHAF